MLLTGTVYFHLRQQPVLTAFLAALSLLTRPDALIFLGPLALDRLLSSGIFRRTPPTAPRQTSITLSESQAALLPTVAWFGFAWVYYGSPIPHSIAAKSVAYQLAPMTALVRLIQHYATPFMEDITLGVPGIMMGVILYPFLFVIGARAALRECFLSSRVRLGND